MPDALNYVALARKANRIELGEEPCGCAARAQRAVLVIVADDASDHTWRRAKAFVSGTSQQCVKIPYTKDRLGQVTGRTSLAMAAFTDVSLALAFLLALDAPDGAVLEKLREKEQKLRKHRQEEKAHAHKKVLGGYRKKTGRK